MANTPSRAVRIPDDVWDAARAAADADGTTVTAVIVTALQAYGRGQTWKVPTASTRTIPTTRKATP